MSIAELLTGGGQFLKWETPGTSYEGTIVAVEARQARKYESTELSFWDDGTPQMQVVVTLATNYRDGSNPDDDGTRMLSINLWSGQKKALVAACKAAGVPEPMVGMGLKVTHKEGIGNAKSPRVFEYVLTPAPSEVATALEVPVEAPTAATAGVSMSPVDIAKQLLKGGATSVEAAAASGLPETTVAALANTL